MSFTYLGAVMCVLLLARAAFAGGGGDRINGAMLGDDLGEIGRAHV